MAKLNGVITQNIDGLHQKAGSRHSDHRSGTREGSIQRTSPESGRDVRLKVFSEAMKELGGIVLYFQDLRIVGESLRTDLHPGTMYQILFGKQFTSAKCP